MRKISPIGIIIKKRLVDLNMTQGELAEAVGVNVNYLGLIIYGYRSGTKYMDAIEKVLGINLDKYKISA